MKNFKSIIAVIAAAIMLFSLTACQNNASVDNDRDVTVASSTESTIATENTNETISVELSTTTATESTTIVTTNSKGETVKATKADNNNAVVKTTTKKSSSSSNNSSYKAPATTKKSSSSSNNVKATTKKSSSSAKPQATTKKSTSSNNKPNATTKYVETRAYNRLEKCYITATTTKTVFTYEDGTVTVGYFEGGHGDARYKNEAGLNCKVADYHEIDPNCPNCHRPRGDGRNGTCCMNCTFQAVTCKYCGENIPPWSCHSCSK